MNKSMKKKLRVYLTDLPMVVLGRDGWHNSYKGINLFEEFTNEIKNKHRQFNETFFLGLDDEQAILSCAGISEEVFKAYGSTSTYFYSDGELRCLTSLVKNFNSKLNVEDIVMFNYSSSALAINMLKESYSVKVHNLEYGLKEFWWKKLNS